MNMKMEEHQDQVSKNKKGKSGTSKRKGKENDEQPSETESNISAEEPPSDYE